MTKSDTKACEPGLPSLSVRLLSASLKTEAVQNARDGLAAVREQCTGQTSLDDEPVRTIHHLSCTGGTLFAKCIASMPNVVVLNEINPFSRMQVPKGKPPFTPTDVVALVRQGDSALASDELLRQLFLDNLSVLRKECWLTGRSLVLRIHSHSQFLFGDLDDTAPTLRDVISERFPVRSVVTTRKPEAAFASMQRQCWDRHFEPPTFEEYQRRHDAFVARFSGVPSVAYEDLTKEPQLTIKALCQHLDIAYFDRFEDTFSAFRFSGDSGRGGDEIRRVEQP